MEPNLPNDPPESLKEAAARAGCILLLLALVLIAGFVGFIFTQGVRF